MAEYHFAGRRATLKIYDIMVGLAVTTGLLRLFAPEGIGGPFDLPETQPWMLFVVLFSFIVRFVLGAHAVMAKDIDVENWWVKILFDVGMLWFHAGVFVVAALTFHKPAGLQWTLVILVTVDLLWLLIVRYVLKDKKLPAFQQWACHNVVMGIFLLLNIRFAHSVELLLAASLTAMVFDFYTNKELYFGMPATGKRLLIFVAGPCGDELPKDEIARNVETARRFGKEIALRGHVPFIPHTMLEGWETDDRFRVEDFKRIDFSWLDECDGLFYIAHSKGADAERAHAMKKGLRIFTRLEDIPPASIDG